MSTATRDRPARTPLRSGDHRAKDPFDEIDGLPPNMGQDVLPHVVTFQGLLRNVARTYYISDEAVRHSWENARFMRNDPAIMECLEQRQRSTALLDWHLEAEDEKDPTQKYLVKELTAIIRQIPWFLKYRENLLHALWYGKYAVSHRYRWKSVNRHMRVVIDRWKPINGDKLVFRYDDGSGEYDDDQVGIRVGADYNANERLARRWKVERFGKVAATDHGLAYFLEHWERPLLGIHRHMIEDGEWESPERAGAIHGVGIRHRLYWLWYQKQETLAWLMEYLERSAFGMEIWTYPAGNPEAKAQTQKAAEERIGQGRNIVLVPRHPDSDALGTDVKRIEPGMAGADIIDRIVREYFGWQIKRYILGQILTSEAASTGLGSGVASIHLDTYLQIIRYDSINLAETVTTETVRPLLRYNWPRYADMPIRFVIETETPDVEGKLNAWKNAYDMGLGIPAKDVSQLIGAAIPMSGEEVLSDPQHRQAAMQEEQMRRQAAQPQPGGYPGQPPGPNGEGATADSGLEAAVRKMLKDQYGKPRDGVERYTYDGEGKLVNVEKYRASHSKDAADDKPGWKTVGGDGTIKAGCPGLKGENLDDLGENEQEENRRKREHRQDVAEHHGIEGHELTKGEVEDPESDSKAKINPRTRVGKAILQTAQDWSVSPDDLADALEYAWEQRVSQDGTERRSALDAAHKLTGLFQNDVKRLKNLGYDYTSGPRVGGNVGKRLSHFDEYAQEIAREYPVLALGNPDDPGSNTAAALWEILDLDRAKMAPMDDPDLLREAAEMVLANQQYDPAEVMAANYESFQRRGEVEKYRLWRVERYRAAWDESKHERGKGGKFSEMEKHNVEYTTKSGEGKTREEWRVAGGIQAPDHLAALKLPPGWQSARASLDPSHNVLAIGIDAKGREQRVYSEAHVKRQAAAKFARTQEGIGELAVMRIENEHNLIFGSESEQESAAVWRLIEHTGIRPGGDRDTKSEKQAYGATTLLGKHVIADGDGNVLLRFTGKKGVALSIPVRDKAIADDLLQRKRAGDGDRKLFTANARRVLMYSRSLDGGGFKTKDLRTIKGTLASRAIIKTMPKPADEKARRKAIREVATRVSEILGNTPTVALQFYIDPHEFDVWKLEVVG